MEALEKDIQDLQSFLNSLEGFNQRICDSSDAFSSYVSLFHSYIPELLSSTQSFFHFFDEQIPDHFGGSRLNLTRKYLNLAAALSTLISTSVSHVCGDEFTTKQLNHIRNIFQWFSDVSKAFYSFNPKPGLLMQKPSKKLHQKLTNQFSKIVLELSKALDSEPSDLQSLNLLPSTFPHHIVAFAQLYCRLTDIQSHLIYSEHSIRADHEKTILLLRNPTPKMLMTNEMYSKYIQIQNKLLKQILVRHEELSELYGHFTKTKNEFIESTKWMANAIQTGFINQRETNISILEEMVQYSTKYKTFQTAKKVFNREAKFDIPNLNLEAEVLHEDKKIREYGMNREVPLSQFISEELLIVKQIRDKILLEMKRCHSYIEQQAKKMQDRNPNYPINESQTRRTDLYQFRQVIDSIRKCGTFSYQSVLQFTKVDELLNGLSCFDPPLISKSSVLMDTAYSSTLKYFTNMENTLKEMIEEKEIVVSQLHHKICDSRFEIDLINGVVETIKYKKQNPEDVCPRCEKERTYVLLTCGHTFCEECYQRISEEQLAQCPYPSCQVPFTENDVVPIEWEDGE